MNHGTITKDTFRKNVSFNKAVLWKTREISIPPATVDNFGGVKYIEFYDAGKNTLWRTTLDKASDVWKLKKEGQEAQYYIPISIFKIIKDYKK